jgi:uncharacterized membrane protein YfcA
MDSLEPATLFVLITAIFFIAILYSMVGHGGASGYIAVMSLASLSPMMAKPSALVLNILVSVVASWNFIRVGQFRWRIFWPFAVTSIPASFIGGTILLPDHHYRQLMGLALLFATFRLFASRPPDETESAIPNLPLAMLIGAVIGLLSGLTGVGGGIFLSPLLILFGWVRTREASGIAALFILCNSVAGLSGHLSRLQHLPDFLPWLAIAAVGGGIIGSFLGSIRLPVTGIIRALAAVLLIAGWKLILV